MQLLITMILHHRLPSRPLRRTGRRKMGGSFLLLFSLDPTLALNHERVRTKSSVRKVAFGYSPRDIHTRWKCFFFSSVSTSPSRVDQAALIPTMNAAAKSNIHLCWRGPSARSPVTTQSKCQIFRVIVSLPKSSTMMAQWLI